MNQSVHVLEYVVSFSNNKVSFTAFVTYRGTGERFFVAAYNM